MSLSPIQHSLGGLLHWAAMFARDRQGIGLMPNRINLSSALDTYQLSDYFPEKWITPP